MTLNQQIRSTIQRFREILPPDFGSLIEQGTGEISALDIIENALKVGDHAPDEIIKQLTLLKSNQETNL